MKFIVTGGKGFIGSNLVDYLVDKGHYVSVIDISRDGYENPGAIYFYNDITKPIKKAEDLFDGVDAIFHLAAEIYIQKSLEFPNLFKEVNEQGTENILAYAKQYNIKKIIFSSTSAIYGNKFYGRGSLESDKKDCLNAYSDSKYNAEEICRRYSEQSDMHITVLRYFNVYGNRQHESGQYAPVIGKFLKQNYENKSITVVGDGSQKRDFINVLDVVRANYLAYKNIKGFNIYNIGSGKNISILELAQTVSSNITNIESRKGECLESLSDISLAMNDLLWIPEVDLKEWIHEHNFKKDLQ